MAKPFLTACIQLNVGPDPDANIAQGSALIRQAASLGAKLIATPENTCLMVKDKAVKRSKSFTEDKHPALAAYKVLASELGVYLLIGSISSLVTEEGAEKMVNCSYLIGPDGKVIAHYDKIHLFDVVLSESESYKESSYIQGGERAVLTQTSLANIGMTICYDLRFAGLYRQLAQAGAQILTIPSAFTVPTGKAHWEALLRARAIETGSFVLAPAQVGEHDAGLNTYGHSMIISPWGEILAEADGKTAGIITAEIDLDLVDKARQAVPAITLNTKFELDVIA